MKLNKLIKYLESIAPLSHQESYDNSGLIVGNPTTSIKGVLICLDSTEDIIKEAIKRKCNVVIAHHPIVFKGLKKFNGKNYVERTVMQAIKHDICIYAIHTNLDNAYYNGVNSKIAEKLKLKNLQILAPKKNLAKLQFYLSPSEIQNFQNATDKNGIPKSLSNLHSSLAARTGLSEGAAEMKYETTLAKNEVAHTVQFIQKSIGGRNLDYHIIDITDSNSKVGSGMIGILNKPILATTFFSRLKTSMKLTGFRHTAILGKKVQKIAICGGAGGFLLPQAIRAGADVFVTADYKYHEFFDADGQIIIADIGHYESEQYTIELLHGLITKKFSNFATHCTKLSTNPVFYY